MKVFVTGVCGQLGHDVMCELNNRGIDVIGTDISEAYNGVTNTVVEKLPYIGLDITDKVAVENTITKIKPDAVIHCAAWTAVDAAEAPENKEKVFAVNFSGTENIALACKKVDCKLVYISTDYVFNGSGTQPWAADCKSFSPLNVYGESKLKGEQAVSKITDKFFIVRIAWVFGKNGNNFIKTMLKVGKKFPELRVVNDQIGTPTYTADLAELLADMVITEKYGFYHATNSGGYISWYDFACEIFRQAKYNVKVIPVTTEQYGLSAAARPYNSRLDKSKLTENGFGELPDWKDALSRYLKEIEY